VIISTIRDLAIIFVALESLVTLALLTILIWQIWRLIKMLQTEVLPVLRDAQDTVTTVKGTTTFMTDNLVNPVLRANGRAAGIRRTVSVLFAELPGQPKQKKAPAGYPPTPSAPPVTPAAPPVNTTQP
jgi:hypothetical protein